jgi:hypothetical protein
MRFLFWIIPEYIGEDTTDMVALQNIAWIPYSKELDITVEFFLDVKNAGNPFPHYWELCVGSCHSVMRLRQSNLHQLCGWTLKMPTQTKWIDLGSPEYPNRRELAKIEQASRVVPDVLNCENTLEGCTCRIIIPAHGVVAITLLTVPC